MDITETLQKTTCTRHHVYYTYSWTTPKNKRARCIEKFKNRSEAIQAARAQRNHELQHYRKEHWCKDYAVVTVNETAYEVYL